MADLRRSHRPQEQSSITCERISWLIWLCSAIADQIYMKLDKLINDFVMQLQRRIWTGYRYLYLTRISLLLETLGQNQRFSRRYYLVDQNIHGVIHLRRETLCQHGSLLILASRGSSFGLQCSLVPIRLEQIHVLNDRHPVEHISQLHLKLRRLARGRSSSKGQLTQSDQWLHRAKDLPTSSRGQMPCLATQATR